jgi:RNA polymerase sigma-70 factor, ECF subfamily
MRQWAEAERLETRDTSAEERRWLERAQAGEPAALGWLVRLHGGLVRRLLVRVLGPREDLDDLMQNAFLETLRALPSFRRESALSTFVAGITIRVARRAARPTRVVAGSVALESEPPDAGPPPEERLAAKRSLERVRRALELIAEPKRVAFLLWSLEGMSLEEIAAAMGASVAATRSRIYYAQKELLARAAKDPLLRERLLEPKS